MDATLEAVKRETRGKNEARRLRVAGRIPAVVYGGANQEPLAVSVDPKILSRILHSESGVNMPIELKGEAKGVKLQGGVLDFPNRDVEIEVLPTEIPEHIEIDVTELTIGQ